VNLRKLTQPSVEVPRPADDRPAWIKVGLIAVAGFVIGVAWPRLAGVHLGPAAPDAPAAAPATSAAPGRADAPSSQSATAATAPPAPAASAAPVVTPAAAPSQEPPSVTVNRGVVLNCKTEDGDVKKGVTACGAVAGFDGIAQPRLKKLAACPAALGANGKLSVVFNIDFPTNRVAVEIGKSSTVANMDAFASCVRPAFQGVSIGALEHQNPHYALFYSLVFAAKGGGTSVASSSVGATPAGVASLPPSGASPAASPPAPASDSDDGTAQVIWEVAIVRDTPRTGQVLARLQRGTKIHLGAGQDGWYRVKYGTDFSSEGWVYRGAIGR
jgi:hypothetical protein